MTDLTTDELNSLTMFRSGYKGAYPLNMMPEPKSTTDRPFSFIFNSDPDFLKGQHWMLICLPPDGSRGPLFIDPLGVKLYIRSNLIRKSVVDYVESFEDLSRLQEVPYACQNPFSLHCGNFVPLSYLCYQCTLIIFIICLLMSLLLMTAHLMIKRLWPGMQLLFNYVYCIIMNYNFIYIYITLLYIIFYSCYNI